MASMTDYLEKKLLDHTLGLAAFTMPTVAYLGLSTSDPTDTGSTAGEPSGNNYSRQNLTASMGVTNPVSGISTNEDLIMFGPVSVTAWGTMAYGLVADAATSGNILLQGVMSEARFMAVNDTMEFAPSTFTITFA